MSEGKFSALLSVIVPPVVELIAERKGISQPAASQRLMTAKKRLKKYL